MNKNYYKILNLDQQDSIDTIKTKLKKIYSKINNDDPNRITKIKIIKEAYDILTDYHKRRVYDDSILDPLNMNMKIMDSPLISNKSISILPSLITSNIMEPLNHLGKKSSSHVFKQLNLNGKIFREEIINKQVNNYIKTFKKYYIDNKLTSENVYRDEIKKGKSLIS